MGNSIDPLGTLIQQCPILTAIAVVILLAICALLVAFRRQQLRLAAMKTQLDSLSHAIDGLRVAHESLLVRFMNNPPRSRNSPKLSGHPPVLVPPGRSVLRSQTEATNSD